MRCLTFSFSQNNPGKLLIGVMILISGSLLVGCSDCKEYSYSVSQIQPCEHTSVLLTDLTKQPGYRYYQLLDGQDCTRVIKGEQYYEKTEM